MGCDIHAWLEVKPADKWEIVPECPCERCDGKGKIGRKDCYSCDGRGVTKMHVENDDGREYLVGGDCYHNRNYFVFAVLAGVRNYFEIEADPLWERGIPDDASDEYRTYCEQGDGDLHSHNWLLLDEIVVMCVRHDKPMADDPFPLKDFVEHLIEKQMKPLVAKYGDQNVRMVFCFDN
jgi:hypothetical protein